MKKYFNNKLLNLTVAVFLVLISVLSIAIKGFTLDKILILPFSWIIMITCINDIIRMIKFYNKSKHLKILKIYSKKNVFHFLSAIFLIVFLPIVTYFESDLIDLLHMYPMYILIPLIPSMILGLGTFLGAMVETYTRNNTNIYLVRDGFGGVDLYTVNLGVFEDGFIIETYIFKYSNINYIEEKGNDLYLYGTNDSNDKENRDFKIVVQTIETKKNLMNFIQKNSL
ncbi:MAG: hypothetical protein WAO56_11335 [Miniphocaeibacter sp.]|uniref:hypothetical protein n=1 Tax=Miniphocaeibacter sp. TaxID=3100973 RepID=UPI003BAF9B6C